MEAHLSAIQHSRNARFGKRVCRDLVVVKDTCSRSPEDWGEALILSLATSGEVLEL